MDDWKPLLRDVAGIRVRVSARLGQRPLAAGCRARGGAWVRLVAPAVAAPGALEPYRLVAAAGAEIARCAVVTGKG